MYGNRTHNVRSKFRHCFRGRRLQRARSNRSVVAGASETGFCVCAVILLSSIFSFARAQDLPAGFKIDRYVWLWERNPFALVTPTAVPAQPSTFDKLFLASWLKDGGKEVIFVQNSETNAIQKIAAEPNQDNLRLVELRMNANPQFVEAMISDGKEQGTVKFRFDAQPVAEQTSSGTAQALNNGATGSVPNPVQVGSQTLPPSRAIPPSAQPLGLRATPPADQAVTHRLYPGLLRVHTEGGPGLAARPQAAPR